MISEQRPLSTKKGFWVNNFMLKSCLSKTLFYQKSRLCLLFKGFLTQNINLIRKLSLIRKHSFHLFPGSCLLCGTDTSRSMDLCLDCEKDLPVNNRSCIRCSIPLNHVPPSSVPLSKNHLPPNHWVSGHLADDHQIDSHLINSHICGACIAHPPSFDRCVATLRYEFPVSSLISRYKYQGHFCSGAVLADVLLAELFKDQNQKPDLIVPVPLHWQRQFFRGFNQSQWLSQYLGRRLNICVDAHLLKRCRNTPPQQGLKRTQRQKNLKGAFQVNRPVEGQHIALVDDVVTTGSTVSELSQLLKRAGASKVEIWCLARTPLEK